MKPINKRGIALLVAIMCLSVSLALAPRITIGFLLMIVLVLSNSKRTFFGLLLFTITDLEGMKLCGKRLADWFEKISAASLIAAMVAMLSNHENSKLIESIVIYTPFMVIISLFASIKFTKYVHEMTLADIPDDKTVKYFVFYGGVATAAVFIYSLYEVGFFAIMSGKLSTLFS